jgi:asparagine synthase (glutamine-hydrolysing)
MCGIAGFQGGYDPALLDRMSDTMAHRGPDGDGRVMTGGTAAPVGLAHRRLSIIDLSCEGAQPMTVSCPCCGSSGSDDLALSYNGEIYNFDELRRSLEGTGHVFHSQTDSEVLLHLYAEHGTAMLERLNGIFAFAIYDGRSTPAPGMQSGDLFLARDGLGVKPLYHATTGSGFLFASELKALLHAPEVSRELDHVAVAAYLTYLWAPAPLTMLKGVRKLPPGAALIVRGGAIVRDWTFYDLPYGQEPVPGSEAELKDQLREHLSRAVQRQLVADVPVGAFLSGGLDSSAIVAMARRADPGREIPCFTIGFAAGHDLEGKKADLPYARTVAAHLAVPLHEIAVDENAFELLERMVYFLDEPQADPAPINAMLIAEEARRLGVPVLLSGAGGDDIFSGYRRHQAIIADAALERVPRPVRQAMGSVGRRLASSAPGGLMRRPVAWRAARLLASADRSPETRLIAYFWWADEQLRRQLLSADLREELSDYDFALPMRESLARIPNEREPLNRMLYLETRHFLGDHNLNYTDKVAMAAGVEVRVPLLDLDLVNFATRLPRRMKQRGSTGKYLFRRAMEGYLPHDVIWRPKTGFSMPLRSWMRGQLRPMLAERLSRERLERRGLFDPDAVQQLIADNDAGRVDGAYTLLALLCIEIWCDIFLDGAPAGSLAPAELSKS